MLRTMIACLVLSSALAAAPAHADKLDEVINSGTLRCGIMLDFPPAGFRDASNQPAGYDVEYCNDMANALGVKAEIVETSSQQRIPALVTNQVDVNIGSMTATLERAKTVLFSKPYLVYKLAVISRKGSGITSWAALRGKDVAVVRGTTPESEYLKQCKTWPEGCHNQSYGSNAEQLLAFSQNKTDALIETNTFVSEILKSQKAKDMELCCYVPNFTDWSAIAVNRSDSGFRDWINLFIFNQVDSGRYQALFAKWFGGEVPSLSRTDVQY
jgi:ABC-type amino acid transport substrate-binding protein